MIRGKALLAGVLFPLLLVTVVFALFVRDSAPDGVVVRAEFQDVDQLVAGHDVRVNGTKVGSVTDTTLTDRGTVVATMSLFDGAPQVRADATASVRVADLLGDVSLVLEPGHAKQPLRGPIPADQTFVATHVQDVLNVFDKPTRTALQALLVELGRALEARGVDVNQAVLGLSPLLREITRVSSQLGGQRAELDRLLVNARALTGQLAPQAADIERLLVGLDRALAVTSSHARDIDNGLQGLPATLRRTRTTLSALRRTARAATPLARDLGAAAPLLTQSATGLAPFSQRVRPALEQLSPVLAEARTTLVAGERSLPRLTTTLRTSREVAPSLKGLSDLATPLVEYLVKGVMGGLGSLAAEPGDQAIDKSGTRNWYRAELVLGCEMFGVPTRPGCLADTVRGLAVRGRRGRARARTRPTDKKSAPQRPASRRPALPRPKTPSLPALPALPAVPKVKAPPLPPAVQEAVDDAAGQVPGGGSEEELLDFLLGP